MGVIAERAISQNRLNEAVVVGKDVLELLTSAMYVDPLCIYREYVQNAADAIDEAESSSLYSARLTPRIDISIDPAQRNIKIRDNGVGVPANAFARRLTSLGASKKRGSSARGFRGVGRLSGLAYCQELIFRSKSTAGARIWEIKWDCRRLRELLLDPTFSGDLNQTIYEVIKFDNSDSANSSHFFEVELRKVNRIKNDILLSQSAVADYLSQVGPVPISPKFHLGKKISDFLTQHSVETTYNVYLNNSSTPLSRPFKNSFEAKRRVVDHFGSVEFFEIPGVTGGTDAVGWLLHHSYYGALSGKLGIRGLRLRAGNVQIGGDNLLGAVFPEPRFNDWAVGEIHVTSRRLIPNGRRDDLEQNIHHQNLMNHLMPLGRRIATLCRKKSVLRNQLKRSEIVINEPEKLAFQKWIVSLNTGSAWKAATARERKFCKDILRSLYISCSGSTDLIVRVAKLVLQKSK